MGAFIDFFLRKKLKGGTTGQTLVKSSNTDHDIIWQTAEAGHTQGTDAGLDTGGTHAVTAETVVHHIAETSTAHGGIPSIQDITYADLAIICNSAQLIPGNAYRITDFRTYHLIPNTVSEYFTGTTEPLIVTANAVNSFYAEAKSETYPQDTIYYEFVCSLGYDSPTSFDRGRIYRRIDTLAGNDIAEDFRNIKYRRWVDFTSGKFHSPLENIVTLTPDGTGVGTVDILKSDIALLPTIFPFKVTVTGTNAGVYDCTNVVDNGTVYTLAITGWTSLNEEIQFSAYRDLYMFGKSDYLPTYVHDNLMLMFKDYNVGGDMSNNVFGANSPINLDITVSKNTFGYGCTSNTFGDNCYSNTFGYGCTSNTFGDNCYSNTFGDSCCSNTFGDNCYSNTFGDSCCSNTFGDNCYSNTFGISCYSNTFRNSCTSNTFGYGCASNTFGYGCYSNTFRNSCASNTFGYGCGSNTFGDGCGSNTFGDGCCSNTFGYSCVSNIFGINCENNTFGYDISYWDVEDGTIDINDGLTNYKSGKTIPTLTTDYGLPGKVLSDATTIYRCTAKDTWVFVSSSQDGLLDETAHDALDHTGLTGIHASGSDDQDLSGLVVKVTGSSLVADTEIAKIHANTLDHASGSDNQDLSGLAPKADPTFTGTVTTPAVKITTGAGAGKVLTSDADGDATWEPAGAGHTQGTDAGLDTGGTHAVTAETVVHHIAETSTAHGGIPSISGLLNETTHDSLDHTGLTGIHASGSDNQTASTVAVTTTAFSGILANNATSDTVQECLDLIDDHTHAQLHSNANDHASGGDTALGALGTKNPPIDADKAVYRNSEASDALVTSTWTQIKAFLKTYFDTLYNLYVHPNHSGDVTSAADGATTIAAKAVHVSMLADGTDGELITWGTDGVATTVAVGTATHVLTSNGAGSAPTFQAASGSGGVPTQITVANEATDTTCSPLFVTADTGDLAPKTNAGLTFNSATGLLTTTAFSTGAATVTTVNKLTLTQPANGATLTIADGKVLTASNTLTLTATDGSTLAIGTGGTLGTAAYTADTAYATSAQGTTADNAVPKATYDAHTILYATTDNTPVALTVSEQTVVGRVTGGNITAIAIDSDLTSVSANDDTIPSAKATKAMGDLKLAHTGGILTNYLETLHTHTTAGNITIDLAEGNVQRFILDAARQFTMPADPGAYGVSFQLVIEPATYTPTWNSTPTLKWLTADGAAPTLATAANLVNVLTFTWDDVDARWYGFLAGKETA